MVLVKHDLNGTSLNSTRRNMLGIRSVENENEAIGSFAVMAMAENKGFCIESVLSTPVDPENPA